MNKLLVLSLKNIKNNPEIIRGNIRSETKEISTYLENSTDEDEKKQSIIYYLFSDDYFSKIYSVENEIFLRFFVDGTVDAHFLGYEKEGGYPVFFAQVGVGILEFLSKKEYYQKVDYNISAYLKYYLFSNSINIPFSSINDVEIEKIENSSYDKTQVIGQIKAKMHEFELMNIKLLLDKLSDNQLLVLDGTLQKPSFLYEFNQKKLSVIGLSKNFSKNVITENHESIIYYLINNLNTFREGVRTPIFKLSDNKQEILLWYLRLYDSALMDPLDGIVKIEIPYNNYIKNLKKEDLLNLVNSISFNILQFRNPNIYPDNRWSTHIYPVYLTETYIKNKLLSKYYFI